MNSSWKLYKLKDIVEFNPKLRFPKGTLGKKVPMNLLGSFSKKIEKYELARYNGGAKFQNNDTIMARITPCLENGKIAFVDFLDDNEIGFGSTEYIVWRAKEGITDPHFIYYLCNSPNIINRAVHLMTGTSGRQRVQLNNFVETEVYLPSLKDQKKIASILTVIDKQIVVFNKINQNLLKHSNEIFKEIIKKVKNKGKIGDYCSIKSGYAFKSKNWTEKGYDVITIKSIVNETINKNDCSHVKSDAGLTNYIAKEGDMVIALTGATLGKFAIVPYNQNNFLVNQRVGLFDLGQDPTSRLPFLYCLLSQPEISKKISELGLGSAQANISPKTIMNIECLIPENTDSFNQNIKPFFNLYLRNQREIEVLKNLKDFLLPKLISGEIDISELELKT